MGILASIASNTTNINGRKETEIHTGNRNRLKILADAKTTCHHWGFFWGGGNLGVIVSITIYTFFYAYISGVGCYRQIFIVFKLICIFFSICSFCPKTSFTSSNMWGTSIQLFTPHPQQWRHYGLVSMRNCQTGNSPWRASSQRGKPFRCTCTETIIKELFVNIFIEYRITSLDSR